MSAAAARRRKQLLRKKASSGGDASATVRQQLDDLLSPTDLDEATAYEALQLAQSLVRKTNGAELAYSTALKLLQKERVSVASQLLTLMIEVMVDTGVCESDEWLGRIEELHKAHQEAMEKSSASLPVVEVLRLHRLQREWLRQCLQQWSATDDLGAVKYGNNRLHYLLATQCWKLADLEASAPKSVHDLHHHGDANAHHGGEGDDDEYDDDDDNEEWVMDLRSDAVQHMCLAERPDALAEWLKALPAPTDEETKQGHDCPPALRDALLSRAVLLWVSVENLRDANALVRTYMADVESRDVEMLRKSYTSKDDGLAPSHLIFCCMLLRICEKDARTGPLFSWLMRSFKRELERMHGPQNVVGYTTKIGKLYFNIQPPPSMMNMVENMMTMMGGPGGAPGGAPGGINPAMMQAALAQMQGGGGMM